MRHDSIVYYAVILIIITVSHVNCDLEPNLSDLNRDSDCANVNSVCSDTEYTSNRVEETADRKVFQFMATTEDHVEHIG